MADIYGVDPDGDVNPHNVRDAILKCFLQAHDEILDDMREYGNPTEEEMKKLKEMNIDAIIKKFFKEIDGDFDNPTKEQLRSVCDKLGEFSANFRNPEIVRKHYAEMMSLIDKLK